MAIKTQFAPALKFTEKEVRLPIRSGLNATKTGMVLPATTGECMIPITIQNENQLIAAFGYPTEYNYKDWFQAADYLKLASNLTVIRPLLSGNKYNAVASVTSNVLGSTIELNNAGVKAELFNSEKAIEELESKTIATTGYINLYNRYIGNNNDIAIAVVSNVQSFNKPLFNDYTYISGTSYYYKKPVDYINSNATIYDIERIFDKTETFASNYYAHILKQSDIKVQGADPTVAKDLVWIDSDFTYQFAFTTVSVPVLNEHYKITNGANYIVVKCIDAGNKYFNTVYKSSDSFVMPTTFTADHVEGATDLTVTAITSNTNVKVAVYDTASQAYVWQNLNIFVDGTAIAALNGFVTVKKVKTEIGSTGVYFVNTTYAELTTTIAPNTHLIIDGNDYSLEKDGKFYTYDATTNTLETVSGDALPQGGYNIVYQRGGDGNKVPTTIVKKFLTDSYYNNSGMLLNFSDVVVPTPNFSKNECSVLVFRKEFNSGRYDLVEQFSGSWISNAKSTNGTSYFIENVINKNSKYIYCKVKNSGFSLTDTVNVNTYNNSLSASIIKTTGTYYSYDRKINLRNGDIGTENYLTANDLRAAADLFSTSGDVFVNILLAYDNGLRAGWFDDMSEIAKETGTAWCVVSADDATGLAGQDQTTITTGLVDLFGNKRQDTTSGALTSFNTYTSVYGDAKLIYDGYNDKDRWVSCIGEIAGRATVNDEVHGSWRSPAGVERGGIYNYKRMLWKPSATSQNTLSKNGINSIIWDKDLSQYIIFDNVCNSTGGEIVNRINARRLVLALKDYLQSVLRPTFFDFNDPVGRNKVLYLITDTFEQIKTRRGLTDFRLVCDETNNTADVINSESFVLDVMLQIGVEIKYININFTMFDAGINIQEFEI